MRSDRSSMAQALALAIHRLRELGDHAVADELFDIVNQQSAVGSTALLDCLKELRRADMRRAKQTGRETALR